MAAVADISCSSRAVASSGVSFGRRRSLRRGQGDEVVGSRPYRPGDHVAWIDWAASARLSAARGTDEFVVREYLAQEAPRAAILVDRRPSLGLFGSETPWLDKPAAVLSAAEAIAASAVDALGEVAYLDHAAPDGRAFWLPPAGRRRIADVAHTPRRGAVHGAAARARARASGALPPRPRPARRAASSSSSPTTWRPSARRSGCGCARSAGTSCRSSSRIRPGSRASRTCSGVVVPFADPVTGAVAPTRFTRREVRDLALRARAAARPGPEDVSAPRLRPGRRRHRGRGRPARGLGGPPAGAPAAGRVRLLAFVLAALALAGPAPPPPRSRGALRRRVPARDGRSRSVRPARRRAAGLPLERVRGPDRLHRRRHGPRPPARDPGAGGGREAALSGSERGTRPQRATGAAAGLLFAAAGAARAPGRRARRRRAAADGTARRRSTGFAARLRLVRESAARAPADRRRALDHLAATLGDAPPAERATRLAWARPEPEPEATHAIADEVAP